MNEVRRIVRTRNSGDLFGNRYQALKPERFGDDGRWEKYGREYTIAGIWSLLNDSATNLTVDMNIREDYLRYEVYRKERAKEHTREMRVRERLTQRV